VPKLRKAPRPAPKVEPEPDKTQLLLEDIRDKLLIISSEDLPIVKKLLTELSKPSKLYPTKVTYDANQFVSKYEIEIGSNTIEVTYTRDTNNQVTGKTVKVLPTRLKVV